MRKKGEGRTVTLNLHRMNLFPDIYFLPMILNRKAIMAKSFLYFFV